MRQGDIVPRTRPYDRAEMTVVAVLPGPWGPIHLAVRDGAIAGLELERGDHLQPRDPGGARVGAALLGMRGELP